MDHFPILADYPQNVDPEQIGLDFVRGQTRHCLVLGGTGSGKSTFLYNYALRVLLRNHALIVLDPHGDLVHDLLDTIPKNRTNKTVFIDPTAPDRVVGFNPFASVPAVERDRVTAHMVSAMKHIWHDSWGPRLEHFLRYAIQLTLVSDRPTLLNLGRALVSDEWRAETIPRITDPAVKQFWCEEHRNYPERYNLDAIGPVLNKVGSYLQSSDLRALVGQEYPRFDLRDSINRKHAVLVNLNRPRLGEEPASVLGGTLLASIFAVIADRALIPPEKREPLTLLVDEFQTIGSNAFRTILEEARKFGLQLVLATQTLTTVPFEVKQAILANCHNILSFRISPEDADTLAPMMQEKPHVLANPRPFHPYCYSNLLPFGVPLRLHDKQPVHTGRRALIERMSAARFGHDREKVERRIAEILAPLA